MFSHGYSPRKTYTPRIDPYHSNVEPPELGSQQSHQMISRGFTRCIAGQVYVGRIMHAGTRARDYDHTTAFASPKTAIAQIKLRGCG